MQRNNQQHEQFLREFGALLTAHTRHDYQVQQPQALLHLADYVSSARRHHRLSRAALAQKTGRGEAEIYALEQGLLPYSELDLRFLHRLATALDEDLETLLLLLGRPVLAHRLRGQEGVHALRSSKGAHALRSSPDRSHQGPNLYSQPASGRSTTGPQPSDNPFAFDWWANLLHKGYLNLIDSVQEGRLFWYVRNSQRAWMPMTMFVCLLCICVGTYSFIGHFDAKSTLQAYTMAPVQTVVPHSVGLPNSLPASSTPTVTLAIPNHTQSSLVRATAHAVDDDVTIPMVLLLPPLSADAQLCDFRTMGKFALCRI